MTEPTLEAGLRWLRSISSDWVGYRKGSLKARAVLNEIERLTVTLAKAEAILKKFDYALNAHLDQDEFDILMDNLKSLLAARREKGGAK